MNNIINLINENMIYIILGLLGLTVILFITVIVLIVSVNKVQKKYKRIMRGSNSKDLEELITSNIDRIDESLQKSEDMNIQIKSIEEELKKSVKKIAVTRYRAFENVGSDLSFSIAILDSFDDGVVITGIYSRHDSTTYAKPINKGISKYELSEEEMQVLKEAIDKK